MSAFKPKHHCWDTFIAFIFLAECLQFLPLLLLVFFLLGSMIASAWWWHCMVFSSEVTPEPSLPPLLFLAPPSSMSSWLMDVHKRFTRSNHMTSCHVQFKMKCCRRRRSTGEKRHEIQPALLLIPQRRVIFVKCWMLFGEEMVWDVLHRRQSTSETTDCWLSRVFCCRSVDSNCETHTEEEFVDYFHDENGPRPPRAISIHLSENIQAATWRNWRETSSFSA